MRRKRRATNRKVAKLNVMSTTPLHIGEARDCHDGNRLGVLPSVQTRSRHQPKPSHGSKVFQDSDSFPGSIEYPIPACLLGYAATFLR